ncbi:MAG TPA: hypothetical protein VLJ21_02745 [Candidatus Binatia bacterium]|nr:hypothetical protein [Candidatus Binatia bacterium]
MQNDQLRMNLASKGWQPHHIDRAISVLQSSASIKSDSVRLLDSVIYWIALALAVLGNFVLSIALIPVLLAFSDIALLISTAIAAILFGMVLDFVLREIEQLRHTHLIIPELFIPAIALINVYIITNLSNNVALALNLSTTHNPWVVSIIYMICFVIPHFVLKWSRSKPVSAAALKAF